MKYIKIRGSSLPLRMVEFPGMGREKTVGKGKNYMTIKGQASGAYGRAVLTVSRPHRQGLLTKFT